MYLLLQREFKIFPVELLVKENNTEVREYQSIEVRSLFFFMNRDLTLTNWLVNYGYMQSIHVCRDRHAHQCLQSETLNSYP